MAVPRNRHSNARKNSKRSHHAKKPQTTAVCDNCNAARMPHTICPSCGAYGDRIVLAKKA
ncbi:MAG: 50S ribosomal protein L32 [Parachlamydiaceae bacterium]|nr:50S ribosomal protein L32 [Parachlamydiaceae bacterium]